MTHVVTENCEGCRFTECVTVCPVECFHGDDARLSIDAALCIDCGACVPICPVRAIKHDFDLAGDAKQRWIAFNAEHAASYPVVSAKAEPLPGAPARRAALGFA